MVTAGRADRSCISDSSMPSTEDDVTVFEGEYCSTLNSGLSRPLIDDWSVNETIESRFSSAVLATQVTAPPLLPP